MDVTVRPREGNVGRRAYSGPGKRGLASRRRLAEHDSAGVTMETFKSSDGHILEMGAESSHGQKSPLLGSAV